jgi:hypothetical protein
MAANNLDFFNECLEGIGKSWSIELQLDCLLDIFQSSHLQSILQ